MPGTCTARVLEEAADVDGSAPERKGGGEEMTGEEAIAAYKAWRVHIFGDESDNPHSGESLLDLLARIREEPGS